MQRWIFYFVLAALATCRTSGKSIPLSADDLLIARRWQTEDGLPQNSVLSIVQTPDGYLWLGTFNGLVRFDGVRFDSFTVGNTPELRSDFVNILKGSVPTIDS